MITLAMFAAAISLALIFALPLVKGFQRPTFQRHPSFTFSASSPVKLMAIRNPAILTPDELQSEWQPAAKTMTLNTILSPSATPDVTIGADVFCNAGNGDGVVIDIGYWIES
jgi:hypothetical protein